MNKIKSILVIVLIGITIYACDEPNNSGFTNPFADVNYEELAISDNDSIVKFLSTHFYNTTTKEIEVLTAQETSMLDDSKLIITENITNNDINYTLYTFITEEGIPDPLNDKGFPTVIDSVFTNYTGIELTNNDLDSDPFDSNEKVWLTNTIKGWANGFTNFKSGKNVSDNGPITYENTGEGYIFMPSGLGYPSISYVLGQQILEQYDQILVFKVELLDLVKDTDHDNDGKPSIEEDANGNGDPTDDFSDTNLPFTPDYLNPNI